MVDPSGNAVSNGSSTTIVPGVISVGDKVTAAPVPWVCTSGVSNEMVPAPDVAPATSGVTETTAAVSSREEIKKAVFAA